MTTLTRRRWRRRLLLAGLLPLLLALAFAAKVGLMLWHDREGRAAFDHAAFEDARESFAANATLNRLEGWVSPYDEGTTRYRLTDYGGAVRSLEVALATVPRADECRVRVNLALAHEALGDAAVAGVDLTTASAEWQEGVEVLAEGACLDPAVAQGWLGGDAVALDARLQDKLRQVGLPDPVEPPDAVQQSSAELLEQRNEDAQRRRDVAEQRRQDRKDEHEQQATGVPPTYSW